MDITEVEKLKKLKIFDGLHIAAINFLNEFIAWYEVPEITEDPLKSQIIFKYNKSTSQILFILKKLTEEKYTIGVVHNLIENDSGEYALALKEYTLANGKKIKEVFQKVDKNVAFLCLEIEGDKCFEWQDKEIDSIIEFLNP